MYLYGVIGFGLVLYLIVVKSLYCWLLELKRFGYWYFFVYDCIDIIWVVLCIIVVLLL